MRYYSEEDVSEMLAKEFDEACSYSKPYSGVKMSDYPSIEIPQTNWHTGTPPVEEIDKDNQYCYALCFYYDGWWLSDYLFKANHEDGCFENSPNNGQQVCKFKFCETIAWQKITPYEGEEVNG